MKYTIILSIIIVLSNMQLALSAMIPSGYIDATVAIGTKTTDKDIEWIGSGFIVGKFDGKSTSGRSFYNLFIVTNRHVIEGTRNLVVRFNPNGDLPSKDYSFPSLSDKDNLWTLHQSNNVDIAVHVLDHTSLIRDNINISFFKTNHDFISLVDMKRKGITEGDLLYILGFPLGIVDKDRQYVITKMGVVARIRDAISHGEGNYLIDAKIYPGNSGGPVVIRPEIAAITGSKDIKNAGLIGVVRSYITYREVAISSKTKAPRIVFEENSGLAEVVPVDYILETIKTFYNKYGLDYKIDSDIK